MSPISFLAIVVVIFGVSHNTEAQSYTIKKMDLGNPACKRVLSELLQIDRELLNLADLVPGLSEWGNKYAAKRNKRSLSLISGVVNLLQSLPLEEMLGSIIDKAHRLVKLAPPCVHLVKQYIKFWIHDVVAPILKDQFYNFFD